MPRQKTLWIQETYLQQILASHKTIEVRVGYANIMRLHPGDVLLLNNEHHYLIRAIRYYPDFEALVAAENLLAIAPDLPDPFALLAACRAIYPPEKEALGVVALEITPLPQI